MFNRVRNVWARTYQTAPVAGVAALGLILGAGLLVPVLAQEAAKPAQQETAESDAKAMSAEGTEADSYMQVVQPKPFEAIYQEELQQKDAVMQEQKELLERRYDLSDRPSDLWMSAKRKRVQEGVRVKLPEGVTWEQLGQMTPAEIKQKGLWPQGFRPLPHAKHETGGMVFPQEQIDAIAKAEHRDLSRFDVVFDLPAHLTPEFPPPIFLTNRPDLGDVSQGQVVTIKNFQQLMLGKLTPFQLEGLRMLVTPFPQQQFNATQDRKVKEPSTGVTCFDCHVNGHTNAAFHLNPDTRPQSHRFRIETPSLRGMFNQQIHGSKRALRSVEDFTEFEQRTAYFDGDQVTAAKKGLNVLDRGTVVSAMGQMQTMLDFPPAPKLNRLGYLDRDQATEQELRGEKLFFTKAQCGRCHPAPHFLDNLMHDLAVDEFYEPKMINEHFDHAAGPMKTTTLRGIKDSPPYLHDGRLLTLEDTVEFFNIVLELRLNEEEKQALTAYMRCL